jgi:hypothetical protein
MAGHVSMVVWVLWNNWLWNGGKISATEIGDQGSIKWQDFNKVHENQNRSSGWFCIWRSLTKVGSSVMSISNSMTLRS